MEKSSKQNDYFTKHLFGTGVECATRLYYYSQNYPETKQALPFIKHAVFNKRLLKALARSVYEEGIFIERDSVDEAVSQTHQLLDQKEVVLFDAVFEYHRMMARLPIIHKQNNQLTLFHIQTKAFDSRKHRIADKNGCIFSKWRSYLIDFSYQIYLVRQNYPDIAIKPFLVLPEKTGKAFTNRLLPLLKALDSRNSPVVVDETNQELLAKIDVDDLISRVMNKPDFAEEYLPQDTFETSLKYLAELYLNRSKEKTEIGLKCKECEFRIEKERVQEGVTSGFNECWQYEMEGANPSERHVFNLMGPGTQQWFDQEIYDQREISPQNILSPESIVQAEGHLSHKMRQSLQIHKAQGRDIPDQIIRPELFNELEQWKYPLHFLDFEAGNYAVPVRKQRSPYHLLVFQFSCHTLQADGSWRHHQWLHDSDSGYQNYELIRALMKVPDINKGTIVQYSNFERYALKEIRRELIKEQKEISDAERLVGWINKIIEQNSSSRKSSPFIADLSRLVKNYYYNQEMGNSLSIKDVLRSVMDHSSFLKLKYSNPYSSPNFDDMVWWQPDGKNGARNPYELLRESAEFPISRGTEAMVVYGKMIAQNLNDESSEAYQQALFKYCELDTLAMMMIYQHWQQQMKTR